MKRTSVQVLRLQSRMYCRLAATLGLIAFTTYPCVMVAGNGLDMTQRPALNTERMENLVLLALTRAGERVFAVGEHGIILFSDDKGVSWGQAKVPVSVSLTNIYFVTPQKGWAIGHGGVVLRTIDSGASWSRQLTSVAMDQVFFDVYFFDEYRGFVVGAYGLLLATMDGGETWLPWQGHIDNPKERHLYGIRAAGDMLYIAGEQGSFFRSSDGGKTFSQIRTPYAGSYFGLLAESGGNLIIFGLEGRAYRSNNAGNHWQRIEIASPATLNTGLILADGSLVLGSQAGALLRSPDHGNNFRLLPAQVSFPVTGIVQTDEGHLLLSSPHGIVHVTLNAKAVESGS